jgi:hypothetical protein
MKILLICFPRTGSTSIIEYYKYSNPTIKTFSEPFNKNGREGYFAYNHVIQYENIFVKHIYRQMPPDLDVSHFDLYNKFYEDFDKIVFLDRKDIKEQLESLSYSLTTNIWHTSYVYNNTKHNTFIDEELENMLFWKEHFHTLAKEKNAKVFYYEDIYFSKENMQNFLLEIGSEYDASFYKKYLDSSNKYRIYNKINSII